MPTWYKLDLTSSELEKPQLAQRLSRWCAVSRQWPLGLPSAPCTVDKTPPIAHPWGGLAWSPVFRVASSWDMDPSSFGHSMPTHPSSSPSSAPPQCLQHPKSNTQWHCPPDNPSWFIMSSKFSMHTASTGPASDPVCLVDQPQSIMMKTLFWCIYSVWVLSSLNQFQLKLSLTFIYSCFWIALTISSSLN